MKQNGIRFKFKGKKYIILENGRLYKFVKSIPEFLLLFGCYFMIMYSSLVILIFILTMLGII